MVKAALVPSLVAAIAAVLFATLGPTKTIAVVFGIILSAAIFEWPIVGLVAVFFSETCFQVLGSAHLTGLPVSVGKLLGTLTLAMWALKFLRDRIALTYSPQMLALLGYFCAMVVVSLLVHPLEPAPENGFFKFLQVALLFWLTANIAGQSRQLLLAACFGLSAAIAGAGVIGILEHFVPSFGIEADDPALQLGALGGVLDRDSLDGVTIRRITGGLGDSNWLAYTLAAVIPLNLFWWHRVRAIPAAAVVIAIAGLQVLGLVLSYTRAGLVGLAVAIGYLLWRRALPPGPVFAAALVGSLVALFWLPAGFVDRMFSLQYLEEGSTPMRKDLTGTALYFALQRPILGYGYGQFGVEFMRQLNTDLSTRVGAWGVDLVRAVEEGREYVQNIGAHNLYLEVVVEYGLLGLIPFLSFIFLAFRDLRLCRRWGDETDRLLSCCLAAGLLGFCACGMFGHAKYLKILWILTGLAAAHRRVVLTRQARALLPAPRLAPARDAVA